MTTPTSPLSPDHLALLNEKFVSRGPHMREIGARVTAVAPGRATMSLPPRPEWLGDPVRGLIHSARPSATG